MSGAASRMGSQVRVFLEAVFATKPEDLHLLIWTFPERRSYWFQNVESAIKFAESRHQQDFYLGVGVSAKDHGSDHRCVSEEIGGIVGLWVDLDLKSDAHSKTALPATVEEALRILPEQFPPTFIIRTGNGVHVWWLFRELLIVESEEERREAANLVFRWESVFRANAAAHGWALDRLADLARLLRVPGTMNCKDPANPKRVEIHQQTDRFYNPSELAGYLDDSAIPNMEELELTAQIWKERFSDESLVINPSAIVPEDILAKCRTDPRFAKTWDRRREDLKDQSQSGYDLALANFGADAGFSEQQIVDLIIHHRRIHNQRPRSRLDYFQRTIAKALKRSDGRESIKLL